MEKEESEKKRGKKKERNGSGEKEMATGNWKRLKKETSGDS